MTDDDDFDKVDEDFASEFDFVDTEPGNEPPINSGDPQNPQPPKAVQTIVSIIIFIAIIAGAYYAYKFFFGSEPKETAAPQSPPATTLPQPVELPTPNVSEMEQPESIDFSDLKPEELSDAIPGKSFAQVQEDMQKQQKAATQTVPVDIRNVLQSLNDEMTTNVNNIKQLETTINSLAITVEQLNKVVNAMDNRVLGLTETVDALSQDLANVKKVMIDEDIDLASPGTIKFSNKKTTPSVSATSTSYTVHAIIPGRAWLKSSNGQIITVTEGDKIGDYGTVATIDATNGIVRTSSGIILK